MGIGGGYDVFDRIVEDGFGRSLLHSAGFLDNVVVDGALAALSA